MTDSKFQTSEALAHCLPMDRLQTMPSEGWKILILWYVAFYWVQRFGALLRHLDDTTQSTLTRQLRELETDGFLHREIYPGAPPQVEYTLMAMGESFLPVLNHMLLWGKTHFCSLGYVNPYQGGGCGPLSETEVQETQWDPESYDSGSRQRVEKVVPSSSRKR